MKAVRRFFGTSFKMILAVIAICNLVALFVFNYQIPDAITSRIPFLKSSTVEENTATLYLDQPAQTEAAVPSGKFHIEVPDTPYEYSGTGAFLPAADVQVINADGTPSDAKITVVVKAGIKAGEKIIEYSATDERGVSIDAQRQLLLGSGYSGPSVSVSSSSLTLTRDQMDNIVSYLNEQQMLTADDGFGNDASDLVTSSVSPAGSGRYQVSLTLTNQFSDSVSTNVNVTLDENAAADSSSSENTGELVSTGFSAEEEEAIANGAPYILLTTDRTTLLIGSSFYFMEYVAQAKDANGNDLYDQISIDGSVDTSTPGEYTVRYWVNDYNGNSSYVKTLIVEVA